MGPLNAFIFIFVLRVTKCSLYTKDIRFKSISNSGSTIRDFPVASRLLCAGLCNVNKKCSSFVQNRHDGRCQLFSQIFESSQDKRSEHGYTIYRRIGVCKVPSIISKGRLLSFDGQNEGSKAWFICDDFHFTNISHGTCRPDGVWEGLDKPCVHQTKPPYVVQSKNRIIPGKCFTVLATTYYKRKWPKIYFNDDEDTMEILHISFRFRGNSIVRNSFISGHWGKEITNTRYWPLKRGREANITVCIEKSCFRVFVDGGEMFTYAHRAPVNTIDLLGINNFNVRRLMFTDWRL